MSEEIKQGFYDTITYDHIIGAAKSWLMLTGTTDHDALIEYLANEAVRSINNLSQSVPKSCVIEVEGNLIKLPSGYQDFIGLRFVSLSESQSSDANELPTNGGRLQYQSPVYLNYRWLQDCNVGDDFIASIRNGCDYSQSFKIEGGYVIFNSNVSEVFSQAQIIFKALNTDEYGRMTIYARYERAVRSYICGMFGTRFPEKFSSTFTANELGTWKAQKKWLKADDAEKSWDKNKYEVQKIMHTMFIDSLQ